MGGIYSTRYNLLGHPIGLLAVPFSLLESWTQCFVNSWQIGITWEGRFAKMKKLIRVTTWIMVLVALAFLSGCASVCGLDEQLQAAPPPPPPPKKWEGAPAPMTVTPAPAPVRCGTYTVEKCDDLWSIAAKPQIYNDALLWPCIFNANRDKIKDPNKLKVGTVLIIPCDLTDAQKAACRAQAGKFPKYVVPKGVKRYCPSK